MMDYNLIKEQLYSLSDEKYKVFSSKLIPNSKPLIGVSIPKLRRIIKGYNKEDLPLFIKEFREEYYEDMVLKAISFTYISDKTVICDLIDEFILKINDWSVCDTFCASFKYAKNNQEEFFEYLINLSNCETEFAQRVVAVMLLNYYINDCFIDKAFNLILKLNCGKYYTDMAIGWFVSFAYIKFPHKTIDFLKKNKLTKTQLKYSISKICQSLKVTKEEKQQIKELFKNE